MASDQGSVVALAAALHRLDEAHRHYRATVARAHGVIDTDLSALLIIDDEPATPRQLQSALAVTSGTITALLDRLERTGLVSRVPSASDRRSVTAQLTPDGAEVVRQLRADYRTILTSTDTAAALAQALSSLTAIAEALHAAAHTDAAPTARLHR